MVSTEVVEGAVREVVSEVPDPELPMVTIADLGILREVHVGPDGHVVVEITPTYSGCPAMDAIKADVTDRLRENGWDDVEVRLVLSPAWTTDWITESGRKALREHGIAPPGAVSGGGPVPLAISVRCPNCGSPDTREISRFGSTACKALWSCAACGEPFHHMKAI